jgi:hypothetical protein
MGLHTESRVVSKTADYTISKNTDRESTEFDNRGAVGAVNFNLPTPQPAYLGWKYYANGIADQTFGFVGAAAGDIVTKNDAAANSVKCQTGGEKIGGRLMAICIRTADNTYKWLVAGVAVGHTYTVAT